MSTFEKPNIITLCGCGCTTKNCPELECQEDGKILFRDDFGGQIQLTAEQLDLLFQKKEEIEHLITSSSLSK